MDAPLIWYEKENLGHKAHFVAFPPRNFWLLCLLSSKDGPLRHPASVLQASTRVHNNLNSALL